MLERSNHYDESVQDPLTDPLTEDERKFSIDEEEFDVNTFVGRARKFYSIVNPTMMFFTKERILEAKNILRRHELGLNHGMYTKKELFMEKRIVHSAVNPATNKIVRLPWRMCSFMPMNILIVVGVVSARTVGATVFWQSVNQTYNSAVNFANRGTAEVSSTAEIVRNYSIAMVSAVGSAVSLNLGIKNATRFTPRTKKTLLAIVPAFAICFANFVNISTTRLGEILKGTTVFDHNNDVVGISKVAGRKAVGLTVISRLTIALTITGLTPSIYNMGLRIPFIKNTPVLHTPLELGCAGAVLLFVVPLALALFKQRQRISINKLEGNFKDYHSKDGEAPQFLYFNKGL